MFELQFVKVDHQSIKDFINKAKHRIIFVKPAFYKWEIEEIIKTLDKNNIHQCDIYFEIGDGSIRFGLGDIDALKLISEKQNKFIVQMVNRIRLSILIVDNNCLIYTPNIAQLDGETDKIEFPNGLYGNKSLVEKILIEFPNYSFKAPQKIIEEINNPFEEINHIETLHTEAVTEQLNDTLSKLNNNPPIDPLKLKKMHFYRNNFKLLKRQVKGIKIKNKKLNLNSFIKLLESKNDRLLSSWNIFSNEDIKDFQNMLHFEKEIQLLDNEFLFDFGRFGYLITTEKIKDYEKGIADLKVEFLDFLRGKVNEETENRFKTYKDKDKYEKKSFDQVLNGSRKDLAEYLMTISKVDNSSFNRILEDDRFLNWQYDNKKMTKDEVYINYIESFVDNKLRFPNEEELLEKIDIKLDFYDISDELLNRNSDFNKYLNIYNLKELREYEEGYKTL